MLRKTIKYNDLDGQPIVEDFYFHLTKLELTMLNLSEKEGLETLVKRAVATEDAEKLVATVMELVARAYGRRSEDNKSFQKSKEIQAYFEGTQAFNDLVLEIISDEKKAEEFIRGVAPADMLKDMPEIHGIVNDPDINTVVAVDPKPWITEDREPTDKELLSMSLEDLQEAFRRKNSTIQ